MMSCCGIAYGNFALWRFCFTTIFRAENASKYIMFTLIAKIHVSNKTVSLNLSFDSPVNLRKSVNENIDNRTYVSDSLGSYPYHLNN